MKIIFWVMFALFLIGNSLFVLPFHLSTDSIKSDYIINYKKDSILLHAVFQDSAIPLKLKMAPLYDAIYYTNNSPVISNKKPSLLVNVSFLDNLDFFSLIFPFYKATSLKGEITFYSTIKIDGHPERDSIALIGNVTIHILASVKGISTPQYVRTLVQKEFINILHMEMDKVEQDINRAPAVDSSSIIKPLTPLRVKTRAKARSKRAR